MKALVEFVLNLLFRARGRFPARLPVGLPSWESYCKRLLSAYGFPDLPTYRVAIAEMILRLPQDVPWIAPRKLALQIKMAQAKQTAFQIMDDAKRKEKAERDAALKAAGAPTNPEEPKKDVPLVTAVETKAEPGAQEQVAG